MNMNNINIIKHICYKLLWLLTIIIVLDILYLFTFYPSDLKQNHDVLDLAEKAHSDKDEILYMAESSNRAVSPQDSDKRIISEMISNYYPTLRMGNISHDAYHASLYYDVLRNIPKDNDVRAVIVTVNMRSFSSEWIYSNLEPALQKQQIMAKHAPSLYKRLLLAFRGYRHYTESERDNIVTKALHKQKFHFSYFFPYHNAKEWDHTFGKQKRLFNGQNVSMDTISLACHYIKDFAYELNSKNPRIKDLDNIASLCNRYGWKLVFNILAENTDQIKYFVGPDLMYLMHQNIKYIQDRYTQKGVLVVNNLEQVRDKDFIDRTFPTEHYCQTGRQIISMNVAKTLSTYFPNDYQSNNSNSISLRQMRIDEIKENMLKDPKWMESLQEKAKKANKSIDEIMEMDAIWVYEQENK